MSHHGGNCPHACEKVQMNTPICDFVAAYAQKNGLRLHMPGHKGNSLLGFEALDVTEIAGADSLYEADGIIRESEENASLLFGCPTLYSTEGSSQCIRAMVYLIALHAKMEGRAPVIWAARNAHKVLLSALALTDTEVVWLYDRQTPSYLSCRIDPDELDAKLKKAEEKPTAVYVTSPDYLGTLCDIKALSAVCRKHGVLLAVDNAHGAYLRFLKESLHPMDAGADLCCDSAHKTLPVLTGGAYLHLANHLPSLLKKNAKQALALFGSTSPSYLILQSLDAANRYLFENSACYAQAADAVAGITSKLIAHGYTVMGDEPLKLTLSTKPYGWRGEEFADRLRDANLECEFSDPDYVCLMLTPQNSDGDIEKIKNAFLKAEKKNSINTLPPSITKPQKYCSPKEALFSLSEKLPIEKCEGRVLSAVTVSCPPAVPVLVSGEIVDEGSLEVMRYYGMTELEVLRVES